MGIPGRPRWRELGLGFLAISFAVQPPPNAARAQVEKVVSKASDDEEDSSYDYQRRVHLPPGAGQPRVVVTEFLTQGALEPTGKNVEVTDPRKKRVPWRVLASGPGDFCRVAFLPVAGVREYRINYGGKAPEVKSPAWTGNSGLTVEARHWRNANLNSESAVRKAFDAADRIGEDYVPAVFHRFNPVEPDPAPFFSVYRAPLHVERTGHYLFFTSSQDCSFLRVDEKTVVASPGRHGPASHARFKGEIDLEAGPHAFEYLHAAAGRDTCTVAAWQPPGTDKPEMIPPAAFGSHLVARLPALELHHKGKRVPREFAVEVVAEAPLADGDKPLLRARFHHIAATAAANRPKLHWDFGDGQTSTLPDPNHIYLYPGIFLITLSAAGEADSLAVSNRVRIGRPVEFEEGGAAAAPPVSYVPDLEQVDAAKLDAPGLLQLVRALDQAGQPELAVKAARAGLAGRHEALNHSDALTLAREVGGLLRDKLDDSEGALSFLKTAGEALGPPSWKAECATEAADVALNDLLRSPAEVKPLLDAATSRSAEAPTRASLQRVWGDWYARKGDRPSALSAYARAASFAEAGKPSNEVDAWRGAFSRSAEAFLRDKDLSQARAELRRWQAAFPGDKVLGYLPLLQARYRVARAQFLQAVALAADLVAVNPESPYADRLVFLAADCQDKLNRPDRALAGFTSLNNDYPGSPLVSEAKTRISKLKTGAARKTR